MHEDKRPRHPLRFGVVTGQHQLTWPQLVEQWQMAEALGFDSVWLFDHFMALYGDPAGPTLEASTLLAALAQHTRRVQLGVLVYGNTHRHPAILAKEIVTVDHVSDGRAILGIGTGWNEREHRAYSLPFPSAGDRVAMLDEALDVIQSLFTEPRTTYEGRYYQLDDAPFGPKPAQAHLPILVGGKQPKMLRVIAKHADVWDSHSTVEELRTRGEELRRACAEVGRDPDEIAWSVSLGADRLEDEAGFADFVREYRAAGVSQFLFDFPLGGPGLAAAQRVAREVMPALREEFAGVRG
jgi:F420-dependent oxidoreductase-like protein